MARNMLLCDWDLWGPGTRPCLFIGDAPGSDISHPYSGVGSVILLGLHENTHKIIILGVLTRLPHFSSVSVDKDDKIFML